MGSFAGYTGAVLEPWQAIDQFLASSGCKVGKPTLGGTTGGSHTSGSLHYAKRARDYGNAQNDPACIFNALLPYAQGSGWIIEELFYDPLGGWDSGQSVGAIGGHGSHVHAAIGAGKSLPGGGAAGFGGPGRSLGGLAGAIPIVDDAVDAIKDLPGALLEAILGMPVAEFAVRVLEVFGGAIIMAAGVILFVRVLSRAQAVSGARGAGRQVRRKVRTGTRAARAVAS